MFDDDARRTRCMGLRKGREVRRRVEGSVFLFVLFGCCLSIEREQPFWSDCHHGGGDDGYVLPEFDLPDVGSPEKERPSPSKRSRTAVSRSGGNTRRRRRVGIAACAW